MAPREVNYENQSIIFNKIFLYTEADTITFKFNVNDKVRISVNKGIFEKGYTNNYTEEIFIITECIPRSPPVYTIKDLNNKPIEGVFYEKELLKINKHDEIYRVEKILARRIRNRIKEVKVRWLGYSEEFDSWIKESELEDTQKRK